MVDRDLRHHNVNLLFNTLFNFRVKFKTVEKQLCGKRSKSIKKNGNCFLTNKLIFSSLRRKMKDTLYARLEKTIFRFYWMNCCWKSSFKNVFSTFTTWVISVHFKGFSFCRQGNNLWTKNGKQTELHTLLILLPIVPVSFSTWSAKRRDILKRVALGTRMLTAPQLWLKSELIE